LKTDHVLTFFLPVPESRSNNPDQIIAYYRDILAHITAVPGVTHASAETGLPLYGAGFGMTFRLEGDPIDTNPSQLPSTDFGLVTPDFFQTFGIRLVSGRAFTDQDTAAGIKVAMVNQDFVNKFLKGKDPLHQRVLASRSFLAPPSSDRASRGKSSELTTMCTPQFNAGRSHRCSFPSGRLLGRRQASAYALRRNQLLCW
jgi:hypothetical protein